MFDVIWKKSETQRTLKQLLDGVGEDFKITDRGDVVEFEFLDGFIVSLAMQSDYTMEHIVNILKEARAQTRRVRQEKH